MNTINQNPMVSDMCSSQELATLRKELGQHKAARIGYASEFAPDSEGLPDVGSIHQNIRALKAENESLRQERTAWRVTAENAEAAAKQAREDALEEAKQAVDGEELTDPQDASDVAYNNAVYDCLQAIKSLKGKTP